MKFVLRLKAIVLPVLGFLVLALLIQNTCPHGFAGKTSATPACGHCALKQHHAPAPGTTLSYSSRAPEVHLPLYVLSLPQTVHLLLPGAALSARPILSDCYTDAFPAELLRPPQA